MGLRDELIEATGVDPEVLDEIASFLLTSVDGWMKAEHDLWRDRRRGDRLSHYHVGGDGYWTEVPSEQAKRFAMTLHSEGDI